MSGYLQRLVSSAMDPVPRVHPVLAPMFASPEVREDSEMSPTEVVGSPTTPTEKPTPVGEPTSPALKFHQKATGSTHQSLTADVSVENSTAPSTPQPIHRPAEVSTARRIAETQMAFRGKHEAYRTNSEYIPLLQEASAPPFSVQDEAPPIHMQRPMPPVHRGHRDGARNATPTTSAPDEIQITIGRIEVTAIHPPAPAVPKARDHQISLDAYLKRRDGRSR